MCVGVCAGAGAGAGGTRSSGTAVGPGRPRDPRSARPKTACLVPDGEDLVLSKCYQLGVLEPAGSLTSMEVEEAKP